MWRQIIGALTLCAHAAFANDALVHNILKHPSVSEISDATYWSREGTNLTEEHVEQLESLARVYGDAGKPTRQARVLEYLSMHFNEENTTDVIRRLKHVAVFNQAAKLYLSISSKLYEDADATTSDPQPSGPAPTLSKIFCIESNEDSAPCKTDMESVPAAFHTFKAGHRSLQLLAQSVNASESLLKKFQDRNSGKPLPAKHVVQNGRHVLVEPCDILAKYVKQHWDGKSMLIRFWNLRPALWAKADPEGSEAAFSSILGFCLKLPDFASTYRIVRKSSLTAVTGKDGKKRMKQVPVKETKEMKQKRLASDRDHRLVVQLPQKPWFAAAVHSTVKVVLSHKDFTHLPLGVNEKGQKEFHPMSDALMSRSYPANDAYLDRGQIIRSLYPHLPLIERVMQHANDGLPPHEFEWERLLFSIRAYVLRRLTADPDNTLINNAWDHLPTVLLTIARMNRLSGYLLTAGPEEIDLLDKIHDAIRDLLAHELTGMTQRGQALCLILSTYGPLTEGLLPKFVAKDLIEMHGQFSAKVIREMKVTSSTSIDGGHKPLIEQLLTPNTAHPTEDLEAVEFTAWHKKVMTKLTDSKKAKPASIPPVPYAAIEKTDTPEKTLSFIRDRMPKNNHSATRPYACPMWRPGHGVASSSVPTGHVDWDGTLDALNPPQSALVMGRGSPHGVGGRRRGLMLGMQSGRRALAMVKTKPKTRGNGKPGGDHSGIEVVGVGQRLVDVQYAVARQATNAGGKRGKEKLLLLPLPPCNLTLTKVIKEDSKGKPLVMEEEDRDEDDDEHDADDARRSHSGGDYTKGWVCGGRAMGEGEGYLEAWPYVSDVDPLHNHPRGLSWADRLRWLDVAMAQQISPASKTRSETQDPTATTQATAHDSVTCKAKDASAMKNHKEDPITARHAAYGIIEGCTAEPPKLMMAGEFQWVEAVEEMWLHATIRTELLSILQHISGWLAPGGITRLSLCSYLSDVHHNVSAIRNFMGNNGWYDSHSEARKTRKVMGLPRIDSSAVPENARYMARLTELPEYSGCISDWQQLLFRPRTCVFIEDIPQLLQVAGLTLKQIEVPAYLQAKYLQPELLDSELLERINSSSVIWPTADANADDNQMQNEASSIDIEAWAEVGRQQPSIFAGGIIVWAQKQN